MSKVLQATRHTIAIIMGTRQASTDTSMPHLLGVGQLERDYAQNHPTERHILYKQKALLAFVAILDNQYVMTAIKLNQEQGFA